MRGWHVLCVLMRLIAFSLLLSITRSHTMREPSVRQRAEMVEDETTREGIAKRD